MAAGAATLRHVREEGLADRAAELGERIVHRLRALQAEQSCIGDVRGRGLMLGVEIVEVGATPDAVDSRPAAPAIALRIRQECLSRGLIVELGGAEYRVFDIGSPD